MKTILSAIRLLKVPSLTIAIVFAMAGGVPVVLQPDAFLFIPETYYFFIGACISVGIAILSNKRRGIKLTVLDVAVFVFGLYTLNNILFIAPFPDPVRIVTLCLQGGLYSVVRRLSSTGQNLIQNLSLGLLIIGSFEVITGFIQYTGLVTNLQPNMPFGGSFANPGPYAVFLACIFPSILYAFLQKLNKGWNTLGKQNILLTWEALFLLGALSLIILSKSRSAWIALSVGTTMALFYRFDIKRLVLKMKLPIKIIGSTLGLLAIVGGGDFLFQMKKDSALGRVFIWKNSIHAVQEQPITGHGAGNFIPAYNRQQAATFESGNYTEEEFLLAGDVKMAYNDILQICVELGLVGTILFLTILISSPYILLRYVKTRPDLAVPFAIIVSLFVAGLAGYPLTVIKTQTLLVICLGVSGIYSKEIRLPASTVKPQFQITGKLTLACLLCIIVGGSAFYIQKLNTWQKAVDMFMNGNRIVALQEFEKLNKYIYWNNDFGYNYASVLSADRKVFEAERLFSRVTMRYDYNYFMLKGDLYSNMGNFISAETAYAEASKIFPSKFTPRYLQLTSLQASRNYGDGIPIAEEILQIPIKLYDPQVEQILQFARSYLGRK